MTPTLSPMLRPTPFHVRTAEHNPGNAWMERGGFTVPACFSNPSAETLAARLSVAMADISARVRLRIHGPGAVKFLSAAFAADMAALTPGASRAVLWRSDGGGVRGTGVIARFSETNFTLLSFEADTAWFEMAAPRFAATVRDETAEKGMLALLGPLASATLEAAGLPEAAQLEANRHGVFSWRGLTVTVSRWGALSNLFGGYEILCGSGDGVFVFDRLLRAGANFGLLPAGQEALETLLLEAGVPIPGIDFIPAREAFAREPMPAALGLGHLAAGPVGTPAHILAGLELDSAEPAAFAPILHSGTAVGATLRSVYSPALRRAIALASLAGIHAAPGTAVTVRRTRRGQTEDVPARVNALPILP